MNFLNPIDVVTGHERLTEIFGYWPSFHDSEVTSIRLERRGRDQWEGPVAYVSVHVFEGYREAGRPAEVKWRTHTIVTFRFATVVDMSLRGLHQQNASQEVTFGTEPPQNRDTNRVAPA